jgi:hypothetical protein
VIHGFLLCLLFSLRMQVNYICREMLCQVER